ncbi:Asp-tRNA(Asn)/Glu-tRNA(Gln) amidotransferase subunit GatC [Candidatus Woesearchaeota archaeon]|nr:Asp-tRNA(Asn)/Glu-tRNA(Gln) amidotransferase subunit GatC [Candidatus Woesearchaeota archaeon]
MEIDRKLLEHVAEVARLKLTEKETERFLPQMKELLEYFSQLKDIDTDNIKPSFQPVEMKNAMREDNEKECLSQDDALSLTEHKKDGYFKGPRAV